MRLPRLGAAAPHLRRAVFGPVLVTGVLAMASVLGSGWILAWLSLGLTAGYALSGSA
ncbi:MAG: hypothetical protein ACRDSR_18355 [Pseudonocardiaceae bacterium]